MHMKYKYIMTIVYENRVQLVVCSMCEACEGRTSVEVAYTRCGLQDCFGRVESE